MPYATLAAEEASPARFLQIDKDRRQIDARYDLAMHIEQNEPICAALRDIGCPMQSIFVLFRKYRLTRLARVQRAGPCYEAAT